MKSLSSPELRTAASSIEYTSTTRARAAWTGETAPSLRSLRKTTSSRSTTVSAPSPCYTTPTGGCGEPGSTLRLGWSYKSWPSQKGMCVCVVVMLSDILGFAYSLVTKAYISRKILLLGRGVKRYTDMLFYESSKGSSSTINQSQTQRKPSQCLLKHTYIISMQNAGPLRYLALRTEFLRDSIFTNSPFGYLPPFLSSQA